jgi:hypothetical protein
MVAGKPSGKDGGSWTEIDPKNMFRVTFEDLPEEDQRQIKEEMRRKMEEVEATKLRNKLACYQRTRGGIIQKEDTAKATALKVNSSPLTHEDLVHLVDVSVASKYGADLVQLTCVLVEDMPNWSISRNYKEI